MPKWKGAKNRFIQKSTIQRERERERDDNVSCKR